MLPLLCLVVPHTSVLMENTAVWGLLEALHRGCVLPSVSADYIIMSNTNPHSHSSVPHTDSPHWQ